MPDAAAASPEEPDSVQRNKGKRKKTDSASSFEADGSDGTAAPSIPEQEFQCTGCKKWLRLSGSGDSVNIARTIFPRSVNYTYECGACSTTGGEKLCRTDAGYRGVAVTALYHLKCKGQKKHPEHHFFDIKRDIQPFIEENWEQLWGCPRPKNSVKSSAKNSQLAMILMNDERLFVQPPNVERNTSCSYGLVDMPEQELLSPLAFTQSDLEKRKAEDALLSNSRKKSKAARDASQTGANETQQAHPFNKDGYRYTKAELDPHGPRINGEPSFRPVGHDRVLCERMDRAPQLKLNDDCLTVSGEKGYCMARASHGVDFGKWYYEVDVLKSEPMADFPEPHCRLGFSQRYGNLQCPVGYDDFSYSWRDKPASKFHKSRGSAYGEEYGPGDTIGFYLDLPERSTPLLLERPKDSKGEWLVIYRNVNYYEERQADKFDQSSLKSAKGSKIVGYKNGEPMGAMFGDINAGTYYPAISLYMGARVRFNFGPDFKHPPKDCKYQPISDVVNEHNARLCLSDIALHAEQRITTEEKARAAVAAEAPEVKTEGP